ncbi:MAG: hypothetical protein RMK80_06215, partial [Pseudobdellovibrionaceae bacterium]|nr:hypothetical protein [Pseudobdellovibrionaceae bacterium]
MWRVVSAYVVDQKGARWFWGALFFSCILGLGFRATFSAGRVERELRFAFAKLEPQLKLKFEKADLVVANHLGLPAILLKISDVTGFYLPDYRWMKPIRLTTNQVELPISLFELMRGRAALNEVRLGDLEIIVPEQLLSVLWQFVSFQDQQIKDSHVSNGYDLNHEIGNKSDERSQFEVTKPHPVERVTVESIRIKGLPLSDVSITFRDVSVEITEQGRLTSQSHVVFRMGKNIEYRNIFLLINYDPQDQFLMASISGRLREGLLNGRFHWDQLRQSFYTEAKIDSAPMRALEQFLALGSSPSSTPFAFLNRLGRSIQKESWVSFNLSGFGYFGEAKNDLQLILGNFSLSSQNESLLIARLNYVYQLGEGRVEPFSVTFKGFPTDRFWSIFFPNYDSMAATLKDGRLNGVVQLNRDRV